MKSSFSSSTSSWRSGLSYKFYSILDPIPLFPFFVLFPSPSVPLPFPGISSAWLYYPRSKLEMEEFDNSLACSLDMFRGSGYTREM